VRLFVFFDDVPVPQLAAAFGVDLAAVKIPWYRVAGRRIPRRFGFISVESEARARALIERWDLARLNGRQLTVNLAHADSAGRRQEATRSPGDRGSRMTAPQGGAGVMPRPLGRPAASQRLTDRSDPRALPAGPRRERE
jgi:hypothetical protein